jgi:hypothetical protein
MNLTASTGPNGSLRLTCGAVSKESHDPKDNDSKREIHII